MPSLSLYVDVQARQLVQGFTNPLPATLPSVTIGDSINLTVYFLQQTGVSSAPYTYLNYSTSTVQAILGIIAGIPLGGTFTLTDGTTSSGNIPYNDSTFDVQQKIASITSWTSAGVIGGIGGPWAIQNGVNGALPALQVGVNALTPASLVLITQVSPGSPTTPAINLVTLALNAIALEDSWTVGGSPSYAFTGSLLPNQVTLRELMGQLLQLSFSFNIVVSTGGGVETLVSTPFNVKNTTLPFGATYVPPTTYTGTIAMASGISSYTATNLNVPFTPINYFLNLIKQNSGDDNVACYLQAGFNSSGFTVNFNEPLTTSGYVLYWEAVSA